MILLKNGDYTLETNNYGDYAVFKRIKYPSGTTAFWQQICKWYRYKKYALEIYNEIQKGDLKNEKRNLYNI